MKSRYILIVLNPFFILHVCRIVEADYRNLSKEQNKIAAGETWTNKQPVQTIAEFDFFERIDCDLEACGHATRFGRYLEWI
ncbi:MAG: hypothetical protein EOO46_20830 [Flavobacterium sp.]|nr:MAG: hypothetical protein EOO46_20830 [Flavobacterium sp.]